MKTEQDYLELINRRDQLVSKHARLQEREHMKATRREEICTKLKEAGIDPSKPVEELQRLERENQEAYDKAKKAIDDFEKELEKATNPVPNPNSSSDSPSDIEI